MFLASFRLFADSTTRPESVKQLFLSPVTFIICPWTFDILSCFPLKCLVCQVSYSSRVEKNSIKKKIQSHMTQPLTINVITEKSKTSKTTNSIVMNERNSLGATWSWSSCHTRTNLAAGRRTQECATHTTSILLSVCLLTCEGATQQAHVSHSQEPAQKESWWHVRKPLLWI